MDADARQRRFDTYQRIATAPLLVNGVVYLSTFVVLLTDRDEVAEVLFKVSWVVFGIDYVIMVVLAPVRWRWIVTHILYLVALVFPPLRVIMLVLLAHRAARSRASPLRDRVGLLALYCTAVIVVFGAFFVWRFERGQPGATIQTYGESLWWAVVTITTVGYGDYVPVTVGGRVVATIVLANGLLAIAVLTGVIVSFFTPNTRGRRASPDRSDPVPTLPEGVDQPTPHDRTERQDGGQPG